MNDVITWPGTSTPWINFAGASRIVSELEPADLRDREEYISAVLFALASAVATRPQPPAPTATNPLFAKKDLHKWAKASAKELDRILDDHLL